MRFSGKGRLFFFMVALLCAVFSSSCAMTCSTGFAGNEDYSHVVNADVTDIRLACTFDGQDNATLVNVEFYVGGELYAVGTDSYSEAVLPYEVWSSHVVFSDGLWGLDASIKVNYILKGTGETESMGGPLSAKWAPSGKWPAPEENQNIEVYPEYQAVTEISGFRAVSEEEAAEFLNFLYGREVCKSKKFFGFRWTDVDENARDYFDLLAGRTGGWSEPKTDRAKRSFLFAAESLLSSRSKLDRAQLQQRAAHMMELTFGVKEIHTLTKDRTVAQARGEGLDEIDPSEIVGGIADALDIPSLEFNPSGALALMDAEMWDQALNAAFTMLNLVEASDRGLTYETWNNLRKAGSYDQDDRGLMGWKDQAVTEASYSFSTKDYKAYGRLLYEIEMSLAMNQ